MGLCFKAEDSRFSDLTRNRQLSQPTQKEDLIFEQVAVLIEAEADGRAFRLIGIGLTDLVSGAKQTRQIYSKDYNNVVSRWLKFCQATLLIVPNSVDCLQRANFGLET